MSNEIMVRQEITPNIIQVAELLSEKTYRLLGIQQNDLTAIYLKGWELGFKMTTAPEFIQRIQGKPTLSPKGHLALLHNSGLFANGGCIEIEDIREASGKPVGCRVKMKRSDSGVEYENTFTMIDAQTAGLIRNDSGWQKYPANMLRWRAIGYCADIVAPDIGGGMLRANEIGASITADGEIIEGQIEQKIDLQYYVEKYGHARVLDAMKATENDIDAMVEYLQGDSNEQ